MAARKAHPVITIGHINLDRSFNGTAEHFVSLIEALDRQGVSQHCIVQNESLARRLDVYASVTPGPATGSPVVAYCLMPRVDVVHAHDEKSAQAGLLLTLTRSMPFVITRRQATAAADNPVVRSIYQRAAAIISTSDAAAVPTTRAAVPVSIIDDISRAGIADLEMLGNRVAARHLRVYRRAVERSGVPALLL